MSPADPDAVLAFTTNEYMTIAARRVLTVDDSAAMRQMVAFTLESAGFNVAQAEDGEVALEMAKRECFALVLMDVNMPNLDGFSLVSALRELPDYRFTPLLMLTTETSPKKKERGSSAGATGWLVKPFQPDQLIATVWRLLA